ncbi:N-acetylglucosamine-6-phosphate deacetylase [Bacillus sp. FJAT-18017]|uniref:N-acetylglucosamine-6-phosphate deacetylase n=1 Tax=Bacillus sp. FJAT-18017 TaxID=1705566 RepID=UPI0006ADE242|nr:N-acetylglucosamine-6-phosphate deacetylase [Bacillus sp. FJAT-18017]ALC91495.1 N-acetylglucosamine-6-phosphate deacetylase [Bacillus sp. FJAT-18017]
MSDKVLLLHGKVVVEDTIIPDGYIMIQDGLIASVGNADDLPQVDPDTSVIELKSGYAVLPGFIDLHIHGAGGADTMDGTLQALETIAGILPAEGTTSFLATTITQEKGEIRQALQNAAAYMETYNTPGKAEILGIHLEGPFINPVRKGAQPEKYIVEPTIDLFEEWQKSSGHSIKLVTLAPEQKGGLELIRHLADQGVVASIGHSDATYSKCMEAVEAGARHVTHLYNGMRGLHHREPGVVGAALLLEQLKMEMIVDGVHSAPESVKLAIRTKGVDGTILITDAMRAKCLKDGQYDLGGQEVFVEDGKALLSNGTLAGSILKMNHSLKNVIEFSGVSLQEAVKMASENPARQLNIFHRKGSIAPGKDADFVIVDENLEVQLTFCRGKEAFRRGKPSQAD